MKTARFFADYSTYLAVIFLNLIVGHAAAVGF